MNVKTTSHICNFLSVLTKFSNYDVHIRQVKNRQLVEALRFFLDLGEAETIALALELQGDLVLLDEQAGRHAAQYFQLRVIGVVGLLVRAKQLGFVTEVRTQLDALRQKGGFYLSQPVYQHALHLAGECGENLGT